MHFRNNQLFGMSRDDKPLVTTIEASSTQPQTSTFVRRVYENCHEIVNSENDYLSSAHTLNNLPGSDLVMQNYSDDETEPLQNFESSSEKERLIH
jgi:hypothetical protein